MASKRGNEEGSVELVAELGCDIAENPLWHQEAERLFFLDITPGKIYAYDRSSGTCKVVAQSRITGGFTVQEDGSLLLFQDGRIAVLELDGSIREVASGLCPDNHRFNDVIADPEGRVFAGAMGGNGKLFRIDRDGRVSEVADGFGCPNGMGFTPDLRGMYFTDSPARKIYYFDYDRQTGNLSNRRSFVEIAADEGLPDGMTVDAEGHVWSALWFGGRVKRYDPDGQVEREVFLPVTQTSSVTFGGPDLTEIYITSATSKGADPLRPPTCDPETRRGGDVYRLQIANIRGKLPFRSRIHFPR
jgi:D-xylonolactonase